MGPLKKASEDPRAGDDDYTLIVPHGIRTTRIIHPPAKPTLSQPIMPGGPQAKPAQARGRARKPTTHRPASPGCWPPSFPRLSSTPPLHLCAYSRRQTWRLRPAPASARTWRGAGGRSFLRRWGFLISGCPLCGEGKGSSSSSETA